MKALILPLMFAGCAIAIFEPFKAYGDARWGDGYGFLLNGGVGFALLMASGLMSVVVWVRRKLATGTWRAQ